MLKPGRSAGNVKRRREALIWMPATQIYEMMLLGVPLCGKISHGPKLRNFPIAGDSICTCWLLIYYIYFTLELVATCWGHVSKFWWKCVTSRDPPSKRPWAERQGAWKDSQRAVATAWPSADSPSRIWHGHPIPTLKWNAKALTPSSCSHGWWRR